MIENVLQLIRPWRLPVERAWYRLAGMGAFLEAQRGVHRGKPMLVVGNGPSLNQTPLDRFIGIPSVGMNKIDLIFSRTTWRPSIIICNNGLVMRQHRKIYRTSTIPVLLGVKGFFMGVRGPNVHYFIERLGGDFARDMSTGAGVSGTVTYTALQYAFLSGADPIIIVGVDHSFKLDSKTTPHAIEVRQSADVNHFDPNYFAKGMAWGVPDLVSSERGYRRALREFSLDGRRVLDATVGGHLDIFPKITIDEAVEACTRDGAC